jgi:hypothetical protein
MWAYTKFVEKKTQLSTRFMRFNDRLVPDCAAITAQQSCSIVRSRWGAGVMASATEDSLDERGGGGTSHMRKRSLIGTPVPPPIGAVVHP